jgi:hypothetical protein
MHKIAIKHKAIQSDLSEFVTNALQNISEYFLAGKDIEVQTLLSRLEKIVEVGPHNIRAANQLTVSLEKTILAASVEQISDVIQKEVRRRHNTAMAELEAQQAELLRQQQSQQDAQFESKTGESAPQDTEEMRALTAQNETLRQTVIQLRQKLAQVFECCYFVLILQLMH